MDITQFGDLAFTSNVAGIVIGDSFAALTADVDIQARPDRYPEMLSTAGAARTLTVHLRRKTGASWTLAQFNDEILHAFDPVRPAVTMYATLTGAIAAQCTAKCVSIVRDRRQGGQFLAEIVMVDPYFRSTSLTTETDLTPNNGGKTLAHPILAITPQTLCKRRRVTITDNTGRGLSNYWVRATFDTSAYAGLTIQDFIVFWQRQRIPFYVSGMSTTLTHVDFRIDVPKYGSTYVDILFGGYLHNAVTPLTLEQTQIAWNSAAPNDPNNSQMSWNYYVISTMPSAPAFAWTPAKTGRSVDGVSVGLTAEGSSSLTFQVRPDATLPNDADSMITCLGCGANAGNTWTNLRRQLTFPTVTNESGRFEYPNPDTAGTISGGLRVTGPTGLSTIIPYNATTNQMQGAIAYVLSITTGDVSVSRFNYGGGGSGDDTNGYRWDWTLSGAFAGQASAMRIEPYNLTSFNSGSGIYYPWIGVQSITTHAAGGAAAASAKAFVRIKAANQVNWTEVWSSTSAVDVSTAISMGASGQEAVWVAVGLEPVNANAYADLTLSQQTVLTLHATQKPTVSVGAEVDAKIIAGTLTHSGSGRVLTLTDVYCDKDASGGGEVQIVIDANTQRVYTHDGSYWYGDVSLSDPNRWIELPPGANTFVADFYAYTPGGGAAHTAQTPAYAWAYRSGYLI